jgi:hypothetical protein
MSFDGLGSYEEKGRKKEKTYFIGFKINHFEDGTKLLVVDLLLGVGVQFEDLSEVVSMHGTNLVSLSTHFDFKLFYSYYLRSIPIIEPLLLSTSALKITNYPYFLE